MRFRCLVALTLLGLPLYEHDLSAQGLTTAQIHGIVSRRDGTPIEGAIVTLTGELTGMRWEAVTRPDGRYLIENVEVDGHYHLQARAVGYATGDRRELTLELGQRYPADFVLDPAAVELPPIAVNGGEPDLSRGDPALVVTDSDLTRLPNLDRDLVSMAVLSPLVSVRPKGALSIAGQNDLYNRFEVDGGTEEDGYYGRSPGGPSTGAGLPEVLPRAISVEAVREFQVLVTPFDVRDAGFAGGLLNAVTRSGSNVWHGSVFGFLQNNALTGADAAGNPPASFTSWQFGGTVSGPIVRDKVHFFLNLDAQRRAVPDPGPLVTDTAGGGEVARTGVSYASATRFQQILASQYGLTPGSLGPSNGSIPAIDGFAKLTIQLGTNSHLELTEHVANGDRSGFVDVGRAGIDGAYALTSVTGASRSTALHTRVAWRALLAPRAANELMLGWQNLHDRCSPASNMPHIEVFADSGKLVAGPDQVCPTNDVVQNALELTDNLTLARGRHTVLVGTHDELLHFRDLLLLDSAGRWLFDNLDSLENGGARHYDRGIPLTAEPVADFHVIQVGGYLQDRWMVSSRVEITAGIRMDLPLLPDGATTNQDVLSKFGLDTGHLPGGHPAWSPRIAANADLWGNGALMLHGGLGLFTGPPPYRWLGNGYRDNGLQDATLSCDPPDARFDPYNQPTKCAKGQSQVRVTVFDPGTRAPQTLRASMGLQSRLAWAQGMDVGLDLLYARATSQFYATDANLGLPTAIATGEGGRLLYGTIDTNGVSHPHRLQPPPLGRIVLIDSRSGDHALTTSVWARVRLLRRSEVYAGYAYSRVRDLMSLENFAAQALLNNAPLDGTLADRNPRPSLFETPHRVVVSFSSALPWRSRVSLVYSGASGTPFTYVVDGDANADGLGGASAQFKNDPVYVPRVVAPGGDIVLVRGVPGATTPAPASDYATLQRFIDGQPCLQQQAGQLMSRNSCRNGWQGALSARLATTFPAPRSHAFTVMADIFNVLNLLNGHWGRPQVMTTGASIPMLRMVGWTGTRGIYQLELPPSGGVETPESHWAIQLSARYDW